MWLKVQYQNINYTSIYSQTTLLLHIQAVYGTSYVYKCLQHIFLKLLQHGHGYTYSNGYGAIHSKLMLGGGGIMPSQPS